MIPKALIFRHAGGEPPELLTSKTSERDNAFIVSSRAILVLRSIVGISIFHPPPPHRSFVPRIHLGTSSLRLSMSWQRDPFECSTGKVNSFAEGSAHKERTNASAATSVN
jgi:hypothetical protein